MDWRNGSRQNTTGSAFRGISSRSRGKGRGRGVLPNTRGDHTEMHSPTVAPAASLMSPPPPSLPTPAAHTTPTPSDQTPLPSKLISRGGLLPSPHRTPSLSNLRTPVPPLGPSATLIPTTGGRPQEGRHHPPNPPRIAIPRKPSLKLDPSTPSTPASPRPKPSRKRSHNRTRSSSKASTTQQVSASPSVSSLRDNKKEANMASASASPNIQSFDPRTNIDTLVERVRAMAMAGSAIDRDKDKEGILTPHDGHIDWAGDVDDSLPDLDDWVKPKHSQYKAAAADETEPEKISELPPVVETADPGTTSQSQDVQTKNEPSGSRAEENKQQAPEPKGNRKLKTSSDVDVGRAKPRGKHGKKKSTSEVSLLTSVAQSSASFDAKPGELMEPIRSLPPLVHPLPPKPQISAPLVRGPRSRGPTYVVQPMARTKDTVSGEVSIPPSCEEAFVESRSTHAVKPIVDTAGEATVIEPQVHKKASNPTVDWANAPPPTQNSSIESVREASQAPSSKVGDPDTHTRKRARAFDPSIDWSKAPTTPEISSRRSPPPATHSSCPSSRISSPPSLSHLNAALPQGRSRSPFPRPNCSPRLSSARTSPQSSIHTRSQMNSPERSPRQQDKEGLTHFRAHSSPQTGPGIRTHTSSRPVITLDALSRISRTLGLPGTTTPPRGPTVEVVVAD